MSTTTTRDGTTLKDEVNSELLAFFKA